VNALRGAASLRHLREQPLWRLLAATKGPVVIALLQSLFIEADKALPSAVLHERLARDVDALRSTGEDLPQAPQAYVAEWLTQGWLTRRFPTGASEEEFELSAEALTAVALCNWSAKAENDGDREPAVRRHPTIIRAWRMKQTAAPKRVSPRYVPSVTASTGPLLRLSETVSRCFHLIEPLSVLAKSLR